MSDDGLRELVEARRLAERVVADPQLGGYSDGWGSETAVSLARAFLALGDARMEAWNKQAEKIRRLEDQLENAREQIKAAFVEVVEAKRQARERQSEQVEARRIATKWLTHAALSNDAFLELRLLARAYLALQAEL
jgi:hypothetical protein